MAGRHTVVRWMYRGGRPNWLARIINRMWRAAGSAGIASNFLVTLEVAGRRSKKVLAVPVVVTVLDNERYLVSMLGEGAQWARNVRAAQGKASLRAGRREDIQLVEARRSGGGTLALDSLD